jgi:hypothetical protein
MDDNLLSQVLLPGISPGKAQQNKCLESIFNAISQMKTDELYLESGKFQEQFEREMEKYFIFLTNIKEEFWQENSEEKVNRIVEKIYGYLSTRDTSALEVSEGVGFFEK